MSATAPVRISYYAYPSLDINGAVDVTIGEVEFDPSIIKDLPAFAAYGSTERLLHTTIRILLANSNQINDIVGDYYALTDHGFAVKRRQPTTAEEVEYYVLQTGFLPTSIRTLTDLAVNVMAKWLHTPIESIVVQISYDSEITSERRLSQQMRECTQMGKAYRQLDHHTWIITIIVGVLCGVASATMGNWWLAVMLGFGFIYLFYLRPRKLLFSQLRNKSNELDSAIAKLCDKHPEWKVDYLANRR